MSGGPCFILVDCEGGPAGGSHAGPGRLGEFGAVVFDAPPFPNAFHGKDDSAETMFAFEHWIHKHCQGRRPVFVSDNPAYDWQHINWAFHERLEFNPFGHSARRIGDFWAGTRGDWRDTQGWKRYRKTPHDHNPVNDARGNAEALWHLLNVRGEQK